MMKKALLWGVALCAVLIFTGCPEDEEEPDQPFKLTISGSIPSTIAGASLLDESDIETPIAIGMPSASGTFTFYHPIPDSRLPSSRPFTTPGNYLVALAEINASYQPTAVYFYCENDEKKPISFPTNASLSWDDFVKEKKED